MKITGKFSCMIEGIRNRRLPPPAGVSPKRKRIRERGRRAMLTSCFPSGGGPSSPGGWIDVPQFTYTGQSEVIVEAGIGWKIRFLTSGTFTLLKPDRMMIDAFLVGGGGGGGGDQSTGGLSGGGGGGGFTGTYFAQVEKGIPYEITIGAGGAAKQGGGVTTAFAYYAEGGKGTSSYIGGNGGNKGGNGCNSSGATGHIGTVSYTHLMAITPADITGERYAQNRSSLIDKALTAEAELEEAVGCAYQDLYILSVNGRCYVLDGMQKKYERNAPYSSFQYECCLLYTSRCV